MKMQHWSFGQAQHVVCHWVSQQQMLFQCKVSFRFNGTSWWCSNSSFLKHKITSKSNQDQYMEKAMGKKDWGEGRLVKLMKIFSPYLPRQDSYRCNHICTYKLLWQIMFIFGGQTFGNWCPLLWAKHLATDVHFCGPNIFDPNKFFNV